MKKWLRRVRGAVGLGLTWATGWMAGGAITGWLTGFFLGFSLMGITINYAVMFGALGFLSGVVFSTVLSITEGRRRFDELSLPRFMTWGALGGLSLGGLAVAISLVGLSFSSLGAAVIGALTLLGAGSAAGTLAIARAAEGRRIPEGAEAVEDASLASGEVRPLLESGP